jgi:hypothetical protein
VPENGLVTQFSIAAYETFLDKFEEVHTAVPY